MRIRTTSAWLAPLLTILYFTTPAMAVRLPDEPRPEGLDEFPYAPADRRVLQTTRTAGAPSFNLITASQLRATALSEEQALRAQLEPFFADHLSRNRRALGVAPNRLQLEAFYVVPGDPTMAYATYRQTVRGTPVMGSAVTLTARIAGGSASIVNMSAHVYPALSLASRGSIPTSRARSLAGGRLGVPASAMAPSGRQVRFLDNGWRLVETFATRERDSVRVAVDSSGRTWAWDEQVHSHVAGRSQGRAVQFNPATTGDNLPTLNLTDQQIDRSDGIVAFTDANGSYNTGNAAGTVEISAVLQGRWAEATYEQNGQFFQSIFRRTVSPGTTVDILFNPTDNPEAQTAEVNAYVHTTAARNYLAAKGLTFASGSNPGIDISLLSFVNRATDDFGLSLVCNAFFSSTFVDLSFGRAGSIGTISCRNAAYDTVVYHEYGHFVDHASGPHGPTLLERGLSEGWGDVLASFISGQALIGEGFFTNVTPDFIRTADNSYVYNPADEIHTMGQAWAGFAWHLRHNLRNDPSIGDPTAIPLAEDLVLPVFAANSPDIPAAVREVLLRDDDDGNLLTGTRHTSHLLDAANRHGLQSALPLPTISGFSPPGAAAGTSVTITGTNFSPIWWQNWVAFNGVLATVVSSTETQITATVPAGAVTGRVTVANPWGEGASTTNFQGKPEVTSFSPASGPVGTVVDIFGSNFTDAQKVKFYKTRAQFTILSDGHIQATVPTGALTGPIKVIKKLSTGRLKSKSATNFTVTVQGGIPTVTNVEPETGYNSCQPVVITGTNFVEVSEVKFGVSRQGFTVDSSTQITVPQSYGAGGVVTVTTAWGTSAQTDQTYTVLVGPCYNP